MIESSKRESKIVVLKQYFPKLKAKVLWNYRDYWKFCIDEFRTGLDNEILKPIHKKNGKTEKENHCPISILPNLSKYYERLMYNQIYSCFHTKFSKFQCGLLKNFNAQRYGTKRHKWYKNLIKVVWQEPSLSTFLSHLNAFITNCW